MSEEGVPCRRCGGEGQPWCRPSLSDSRVEVCTFDCEDCGLSTSDEHANMEDAEAQWDRENQAPVIPPQLLTPPPASPPSSAGP